MLLVTLDHWLLERSALWFFMVMENCPKLLKRLIISKKIKYLEILSL